MGYDANVICIGPFQKSIAKHLDYSEDEYDSVEEGTIVIATLFNCNTTDQSLNLADCLGCDPCDFNTHQIKASKVKWGELLELTSECAEMSEKDVEGLGDLFNNLFICLYQPNK
jgi:hypothetical protein